MSRFACLAPVLLAFSPVLAAPSAGDPLDVVPFGQVTHWEESGKDYGVMWEDSRDVCKVVIEFAAPAEGVRLQYWKARWPEVRIPRDQPSGSGSEGWIEVGDWYQGEWKDADAEVASDGGRLTYTFRPVNAKEFPDLKDFAATYRATLKVRVLGRDKLPPVKSFAVYTDSTLQPVDVEVEGKTPEALSNARLEVFNGYAETPSLASGANSPSRLSARVLYAKVVGYNSFDETVLTFRTASATFSVAAADLIKHAHIFIPDYGVIVRKTGDTTTYAAAEKAWQAHRGEPIYDRVMSAPEQTFPQAWNDMPAKDPHHIPLSFEGGRQHFRFEESGDLTCVNDYIRRLPGKDTPRCQWGEGTHIFYRFGLPASRPVSRQLMHGDVPVMTNVWESEGVLYRQTAFAVPLQGVPTAGGRIWADDTLVLMMRIEMEKVGADVGLASSQSEDGLTGKMPVPHEHSRRDGTVCRGQPLADKAGRGLPRSPASCPAAAGEKRQARLTLSVAPSDKPEALTLVGGRFVAAAADNKLRRMAILTPRVLSTDEFQAAGGKIEYRTALSDARPKATVDIAIPYTALTEGAEWTQLQALAFEPALAAVRDYWRGRIAAGAQITTPEPMINDFYRAHVSHLLINTEREVGVSDRYMAKVGSFHYGVYSNESCMMISDLDRRGYHERAEQALETWLHYQGTVGLPGDFSTTDGQLYGAGGYEMGGYNQHHGWILWCMGEHYWYTRDARWLAHAAPYLVQACDWVTKERQRTTALAGREPLRAIERGLLPQGRLEDIGDWRSWLSTNVYTWWGMRNTAAALAAGGHPEGKRLLADADAYGKDILAAWTEAMRRSPVVRLRDGSWIPHIPADVHRRGRSFGWITETLEGPIHLVRCELLDPKDRLSTWILKDYEDNLYMSEQYGYSIKGAEFDRYWFSRGGISQQANLLCNPIPYLLRDEPKHFLRAYFNAFAVSYFPDTRMMTEHALPNLGDWRGDHYKSSDEANSTYWLRLMFIEERGDELWLGAAIPRYWLADGQKIGIERAATYFGPMSMSMQSNAASGQIQMVINPPRRNPPKAIWVRFRHPAGAEMVRCEANGTPCEFDRGSEWAKLPADIAGKGYSGWSSGKGKSDQITVTAYYK